MQSTQLAQAAYGSYDAPTRTSSGTELAVFSRITHRLTPAHQEMHFSDFILALHENQKLWIQLAVDVADEENRLPRDLRARLFYLAEFTRLHTSRILRDEAGPQALFDINSAVMQGLRQQGRVS